VLWFSSSGAVIFYVCLLILYLLRRRRACFDLPEGLVFALTCLLGFS
jgi:hypothetical protein